LKLVARPKSNKKYKTNTEILEDSLSSLSELPKSLKEETINLFPETIESPEKPSRTAREIISKSQTSHTNCIKTKEPNQPPSPSFSNHCWFPTNMTQIINYILSIPSKKMEKPLFLFKMSQEAALKNWEVLSSFQLDLDKALQHQNKSQLGYGSEFRSTDLLDLLLQRHPLWNRLKSQFEEGANFPLTPLSLKERKHDLLEALEFGNHKGVSEHPELFEKMMQNDVDFGYSLILPRDKIEHIPGALIAPMNIADQSGINERGEIIKKKRLTHNQSCTFQSGTSMNNRTIKDDLQDVMYGPCLLRVIHLIVEYRSRHPHKRILLSKIDFKSAYRRSHLKASTAVQTITQYEKDNLAFLSLRLTFGGSPNPNIWSEVSETATDLSNALLACETWNPKILHSPLQDLIPPPIEDNDERPFTQALPMAVEIHANKSGQVDCYIDDLTTVTVDIDNNQAKCSAAVLTAIHILGRPVDKDDPIKRVDLVSISKLIAEAALEEWKILLGWKLDTRSLIISLPFEKYRAWSDGIIDIINRQHTTHGELETLIGRLGHVTLIIPYSKHFMSRLRKLMFRAKNRRQIKTSQTITEDLKLHLDFLKIAHTGISMNLLTYRAVTRLYRSDACPAGVGGYSSKGRGWRLSIPPEYQLRMTLNMLEHLGTIIGPWVDIIENNLPPFSCILAMSDSTTAAGWLRKSNFKDNESESTEMTEAKIKLSRDHAMRLLTNNCKDYSQYFPGDENDLADSLSRDFHLSDTQLTKLFHNFLPHQTPVNFKISPLPPQIVSYIFSILQTLPEKTQLQEKHKTSSLCRGSAGRNFLKGLDSEKTSSLKNCQQEIGPSSCQHSDKNCVSEVSEVLVIENLQTPFTARQCQPPWTTYQRPSETMTSMTHAKTNTASLADFYKNSSRATRIRTQERLKKKRSLSQSSGNSTTKQNQK
jgi:hypothetical protein